MTWSERVRARVREQFLENIPQGEDGRPGIDRNIAERVAARSFPPGAAPRSKTVTSSP